MAVFIHPLAVVEAGAAIGDETRIWHWAHVRADAVIGEQCNIGKSVYIDKGVHIGSRVKIQNNVSVYHGVEIADGVFIGPHVCFTNDLFPRAISPAGLPRSEQDWQLSVTRVQYGASIGANSTIVAGVTLGSWCMAGAGAVVTRNVPPYALVRGSPARVCGIVSPAGEIISRRYAAGEYPCADGRIVQIEEAWCSGAAATDEGPAQQT